MEGNQLSEVSQAQQRKCHILSVTRGRLKSQSQRKERRISVRELGRRREGTGSGSKDTKLHLEEGSFEIPCTMADYRQ